MPSDPAKKAIQRGPDKADRIASVRGEAKHLAAGGTRGS